MIKTDSVSQQDSTTRSAASSEEGDRPVGAGQRQAARSSSGLQPDHAPFDGVITARNTDIGALIDSGSNAKELFHIAASDRLRVFVNVPQIYSRGAGRA